MCFVTISLWFALMVYLYSKKIIVFLKWFTNRISNGKAVGLKPLPGPIPLPVLGNLHLLGKYESPFQDFTALSKEWGDIYGLTMGSRKCVVVNNLPLIKEVLNTSGKFFAGRPDFLRFNKLFAGDRNNSLALCDWSKLQSRRRNIARIYCGPKEHTNNYARIGYVAFIESMDLLTTLLNMTSKNQTPINIKPILMKTAMNMFTHYMCSMRFDIETDREFIKIVNHFDEIFWELNQGYAVDFIPWLAPFYNKHMENLSNWSLDIRSFILSRIVEPREENFIKTYEDDFLEGMLRVLREDPSMDRNKIIFMLEDFLGGHSSVGNLVMLCLTAVARDPEVGENIIREIEGVTEGKRSVKLSDKNNMPYTEATILEALRYASSPIVPHVATEDTSIAGYFVEKDTVVFINNYELNTSEVYWDEPEKFDPNRFLERTQVKERKNSPCEFAMETGIKTCTLCASGAIKEVVRVRKNIPHFLPFSIGKRTCIGQTLVKTMSFVMFANIMNDFDIQAVSLDDMTQKPACVALPKDTYSLYLIPREPYEEQDENLNIKS